MSCRDPSLLQWPRSGCPSLLLFAPLHLGIFFETAFMAAERRRNKAAIGTARVIPVLLCLIVIYCSYVVTGPLSINYLINSPTNPRIVAGIAIPIFWFLLLIPVVVAWIRLLVIVICNPGYVPLGDKSGADHEAGQSTAGLEAFYEKDVFVCDQRGLPIWCSYCNAWKPDRAHHSQDAGRCTLRMDHFCPWVGGVVGERSYKFFFQFLFYSLILSTYLMILMAYFVRENRSNVQWILALGLAGFFVLFTLGMVVNNLNLTFKNVTMIESIDSKSKTMLLAVLLPPDMQSDTPTLPPPASILRTRSNGDTDSERPLISEIDDPSHANYFSRLSLHHPHSRSSRSEHWRGTVTYPLNINLPTDRPPLPAPTPRTFAILETANGMNPWDLGTPWRNFTAILGPNLHDWLLPIKHSPCFDHSSSVSFYPLGPDFEDLLWDSGLMREPARTSAKASTISSSRRKRKRRLPEGWQNGERPDGWVLEKEARRQRNEWRRRVREQEERARDVIV